MSLPRARPPSSGYVNPLSGAHVTAERIDMGVDYAGHGPVRAIGDAMITAVEDLSHTAWGGWWVQYQLLGGPYAGRTVYVAEGIRPLVRARQRVPAGTPIASIVPGSSTGIEMGFGSGEVGSTYAQQHGGYLEGWRTAAGNAMSNLIASLGGPAGLGGGRPTHGTFREASGTGASWAPCTLTWYDPALGGTNSSSGKADPHSATASGEPYNANAFTCAAPPSFPFGTMITFRYRKRTVTCKVNDRGGAIQGSHFDLSRAAAERVGIINAGSVHAEYSVGTAPPPPDSGVTRPGGSQPADDQGKALEAMYRKMIGEGQQADAAIGAYTKKQGAAKGKKLPGHGPKAAVDTILPGIGPFPSVPGLPDFNPVDWFNTATEAIQSTQDLLKLVGWILNPRNVLRAVEFLVGLSLIFIAVRINMQVFADAANEKAARIFGRRRKGGRGKRGRTGGSGRTRELAYQSGKRRIAARTGPAPKSRPVAKSAAGKGRVASAAGKTKTVLKLIPK